ncbi:hypothetical protein HDC92_004971 [Pedobacter sp. AK017]|uniref:hypothetical protein n=1 Tax=Pedobacter sp. AK017 TaxID=2723073 RepID=UPI001612C457|nr:hypothetical protein [Pedobacter sp. AK017]MBB5441264.1 hypothetical protein [Pedobacter sp. AK017]
MKKVTLFLAAAAIIGVGSAFTAKTVGIGDEYVNVGRIYYLKSDFLMDYPDFYCTTSVDKTCTWLSIVVTTNPSHHTPAPPASEDSGFERIYIQ